METPPTHQPHGIWRVGWHHNSYLAAIDPKVREVSVAIQLIRASIPEGNFETYDRVEFLGVVQIPIKL